jgi:hypothetical protein
MLSETQSYWNLANFRPQLGAFLKHYHINIKSSYAQLVKKLIAFEISVFWSEFLGVVSRRDAHFQQLDFHDVHLWRDVTWRWRDTALTPLTLHYTCNNITDVRGPRSQFYILSADEGEKTGVKSLDAELPHSEVSSKVSFGYTSSRVYIGFAH